MESLTVSENSRGRALKRLSQIRMAGSYPDENWTVSDVFESWDTAKKKKKKGCWNVSDAPCKNFPSLKKKKTDPFLIQRHLSAWFRFLRQSIKMMNKFEFRSTMADG